MSSKNLHDYESYLSSSLTAASLSLMCPYFNFLLNWLEIAEDELKLQRKKSVNDEHLCLAVILVSPQRTSFQVQLNFESSFHLPGFFFLNPVIKKVAYHISSC